MLSPFEGVVRRADVGNRRSGWRASVRARLPAIAGHVTKTAAIVAVTVDAQLSDRTWIGRIGWLPLWEVALRALLRALWYLMLAGVAADYVEVHRYCAVSWPGRSVTVTTFGKGHNVGDAALHEITL